METPREKLRNILGTIINNLPDDDDENLFSTRAFDSLKLVEVIELIECTYKIVITPEYLSNENFSTINKILKTVQSLENKPCKT